ncbi:MAG: peptidylprolyl isomerase, partial [Dehalococcoidales bacterium]
VSFALVGGAACAPRYAGNGDTVSVHYTGTLDDGSQFDSSVGGDPIEFVLGQPGMIAGFARAVYGMRVGETKTVTIPSAQAYGPRNETLVMELALEDIPGGSAEVGQSMQVTFANGRVRTAVVTEVSETTATVDANSLLAGKDLTFEIKLVSIR